MTATNVIDAAKYSPTDTTEINTSSTLAVSTRETASSRVIYVAGG